MLRPPDAGKCHQYCEWFLDFIYNSVSALDKTFLTVKAWFHLSEYINSQNAHIWTTGNPLILCEVLLHTKQIVWCAVLCKRIVGALFFESTVDGEILCNSL